MAASSPLGKDFIKDWFANQKDIKVILDVGAGSGTYRKLLGDQYKWKAVEVWQENIDKYELNKIYDLVYNVDISNSYDLFEADCIIFGDVIEHLPKRIAKIVLSGVINKYHHVVVSIPIGKYVQGAIDGNPYEEHKSYWTYEEVEDLTSWKLTKTFIINPDLPDLKIGVFIK